MLKDDGYHLFTIGWRMRGLELGPVERGPLAAPFEAPSFVATTEPEEVIARTAPRGWQVLSERFSRRRT